MEWQPIETAPKDGTQILASNRYSIWVAQWLPALEVWHGMGFCIEPTHWMPLPELTEGE